MTDKDTKSNGKNDLRHSITSDEINEWDEAFNNGPPDSIGVARPLKDPRPKYNVISMLFFL